MAIYICELPDCGSDFNQTTSTGIIRICVVYLPLSYLGAFDVVMQVVSEEMDKVDRVVPNLFGRVPREQDECYVAHPLTRPRVRLFKATRRVTAE